MSMTRQERAAKNEILSILSQNGYPTYANLLDDFDINLTEDPGVVGYMLPSKGVIVLNKGLDIEQVSTIVRHEILHEYLKHEQRLLNHLEKSLKPKEDLEEYSIEELKNILYSDKSFNIAADYEISNRGYTDKDKEVIRGIKLNGQVLTGLVTEDEHPDWVDMAVEDMYDELQKLRKKDSKMEPEQEEEEIVYGEFVDDTTFVDHEGNVWGEGALSADDDLSSDDLINQVRDLIGKAGMTDDMKNQIRKQLQDKGYPDDAISKLLD